MRKNDRLALVMAVSVALFLSTLMLVKSLPSRAVSPAEYIPIVYEEYHPYIAEETEIVTVSAVEEKPEYIVYATDEEKDLMARVVMSEASILPLEGKQAVAAVIINRFLSDKFPNNITEVCNQPYQFSQQDNGDPNAECYEAVEAALKYEAFPRDMFYFRTNHFFDWAEDYIVIGNTYFSLEP